MCSAAAIPNNVHSSAMRTGRAVVHDNAQNRGESSFLHICDDVRNLERFSAVSGSRYRNTGAGRVLIGTVAAVMRMIYPRDQQCAVSEKHRIQRIMTEIVKGEKVR